MSAAPAGPARADLAVPTDFVDEVIYHGLEQPVGIAVLSDERVLVVEKETARVRLIINGALAATDPVLTVPDVDAAILEQGLLGIAVDPGWPERPYIYVHYNYAGTQNLRISRFTVAGDLAFEADGDLTIDPATRYDILTDLPDNVPYHNGGTLRFGPDGMLYDSIGDDYAQCGAQDLTVLVGKILRLDVSQLPPGGGGPPPKSLITPADNPFVTHANENARLVAHRGMRNPFRFAIDPVTGDLLVGDVGLETQEELDFLTGHGQNLQWPIYEGEVPGPTTCAGVDSSSWVDPIHVYGRDQGGSVIAGVIYRRSGSASRPFPPEYEGDVFFSDFYWGWVRRLKRTGNVWAPAPAPGQPNTTDWGFDLGATVISDWLQGPDGSLWYCHHLSQFTQGPGEIRRIRYTGTVSVPGPAAAGVEFRAPYPSPSPAGVTFEFRLAEPGPVTLAIHDLAGRTVRTLAAHDPRPAGSHRLGWDGRGGSGSRMASGVYLARLGAAGRTFERRLVLLD